MAHTILISEDTKALLKKIKQRDNVKSYDEVLRRLVREHYPHIFKKVRATCAGC